MHTKFDSYVFIRNNFLRFYSLAFCGAMGFQTNIVILLGFLAKVLLELCSFRLFVLRIIDRSSIIPNSLFMHAVYIMWFGGLVCRDHNMDVRPTFWNILGLWRSIECRLIIDRISHVLQVAFHVLPQGRRLNVSLYIYKELCQMYFYLHNSSSLVSQWTSILYFIISHFTDTGRW